MATEDDASKARANSSFRSPVDQYEKGSAMTLIADEAKATADKTARLRKLREEREATEAVADPVKPAPKATRKSARK